MQTERFTLALLGDASPAGATGQDAVPRPGETGVPAADVDPFPLLLLAFVLAVVLGGLAVRSAKPARSMPLIAATCAIGSVIVVGAILPIGVSATGLSTTFGFLALVLASTVAFGGLRLARRLIAARAKSDR